jgi:hypothetical protein
MIGLCDRLGIEVSTWMVSRRCAASKSTVRTNHGATMPKAKR